MIEGGPALRVMSLRQLSISRPQGCCAGLLDDIRQIHTTARHLFHGVLGQPFIDPATLEKMLWSLERQIEAGQDLQPPLVDCGAGEEIPAALVDLISYLENDRRTVAGRLGEPVARRH